VQAPENVEEDPDDPEQTDEGGIKMEHSSDYLCSPRIGALTKYYL